MLNLYAKSSLNGPCANKKRPLCVWRIQECELIGRERPFRFGFGQMKLVASGKMSGRQTNFVGPKKTSRIPKQKRRLIQIDLSGNANMFTFMFHPPSQGTCQLKDEMNRPETHAVNKNFCWPITFCA